METTPTKPPKVRMWISFILQTLLAFMFLLGAVANLTKTETAVSQAIDMGYPESSVGYLGWVLLVCTLLYMIPKTNMLGALLLTAWLGGAVATHIIHGDPLVNLLFPVIFGVLIWVILLLRDRNLGRMLPLRR